MRVANSRPTVGIFERRNDEVNRVGGKKDLQYGISSGLTRVLERKERRRRKRRRKTAVERGQEEKKEKERKRKKLKGATKWR